KKEIISDKGMKNPDNFDKLICRFIIKGWLTNLTQLHVGTGRDESQFNVIDNPLIRIKYEDEDLPYIPGSTLKGIFRNEIERYLRSINDKEEICYPYDPNGCNSKKISEICSACKIFGNTQLGSHFLISDAILDKGKGIFSGTIIKPGNAIDRITGTAKSGALYFLETIQPGACFRFEFQIHNIDLKISDKLSNAIKYILRELTAGNLQIGGRRSIGLGKIKILEAEVTEIRPENLENFEFNTYPLEELLE
ncbi:MAG: type III CRISPR-associated RAMP protein Csx7, partial [Promethearchaeota archaeon]